MNNITERLARARWSFMQPLAHYPSQAGAPVSDLFVWRTGEDWETYFELTDMVAMYDEGVRNGQPRSVEVVLFDSKGQEVRRQRIASPLHRRNVLDISALVPKEAGELGTFCVLHETTPESIAEIGSSLSERGYISFRYKQAPLRGYVHGNLNAASRLPDGRVERLAGSGFLGREFRLQHELRPGFEYEIGVVNPSRKAQTIQCDVLSVTDGRLVETLSVKLPSGGVHAFPVKPVATSLRIVLRSRLVMARPLVFSFKDQKLAVLHG
jgi:hypothetical protein